MLQTYDDPTDPSLAAPRVAALRVELARRSLAGFLVPRADEYQGEYVPKAGERLFWLTGFSGSAGTAAVLMDKAAVFVDGRYTAQARRQVDATVFSIEPVPPRRPSLWFAENAKPGDRIGYDPRILTKSEVEQASKTLAEKSITLVACGDSPLDAVWTDRPAPPGGRVVLHPAELAGRTAAEKVAEVQAGLAARSEDAVVLTAADSIAWLLNIRGADLRYTPFALSYAIVPAKGPVAWFIDARKLDDGVIAALAGVATPHAPDRLEAELQRLGTAKAKVSLNANGTGAWFFDLLEAAGATIMRGDDPCTLPKAKKTAAELAGARAAHARDAVALCQFLAWLAREAPRGQMDEVMAAMQLEKHRHNTGALLDLSFDSISAAGPNAALPHYRPTNATNRRLEPNSVYLIDSGGQYRDGTTDVTRTIAIGTAPQEARERSTLVLKGMIAVATARYPKGTRGVDLDPLARRALWAAGHDFDHGTGHGIGSYLSVHEGPQGISKRSMAELEPGMIVSDEPGFYLEGAYGIRIENLLVVTEPSDVPGGTRPMHGFETLTLAPFDHGMIVPALLDAAERAWLDAYHARVLAEVGPKLDAADRAWLAEACRPVGM
jgi:Xaa-Pro aminopeptidase